MKGIVREAMGVCSELSPRARRRVFSQETKSRSSSPISDTSGHDPSAPFAPVTDEAPKDEKPASQPSSKKSNSSPVENTFLTYLIARLFQLEWYKAVGPCGHVIGFVVISACIVAILWMISRDVTSCFGTQNQCDCANSISSTQIASR